MGGGAEGNTATRIEASPSDRGGGAGHGSCCRDGSGDGRRARRDYAACIGTDGACHRHRARTRDGAIDAASSTANARAAAAKPPTAGRYKIVQCRNWKETGSCRFGDSCTYAHGNEELTMHKQIAALSQIPGMQ